MIIEKIFTSLDILHQINTKIIDDICWFEIIKFDFDNQKTFLLLIKDIIDYFKINNIKFIKQYVINEDVEYFKNSSFVILNDNYSVVSTPINYFIDDFINALGIKKI
jgi:hypothetical protein